jgi:pyridoxine kinase
MGDQGRLYVDEGVVPAYKNLLRDADLLLPNQFEAEYVESINMQMLWLTAIQITFRREDY